MSLEWINPAALAGLAAAVGPIVVHLLRRQRATRVLFPTIRFLAPSRAAATRFKRPADPLLLALRVAIVAAAAIAVAQPVLLTGWRRAASERTVHRALVIDSSESMTPAASRVAEAVAGERQQSADAIEIRTPDLADGLKQASASLQAIGGGRAEIVVISDFQRGSLDSSGVALIPEGLGLRLVRIGRDVARESFAGWRGFAAAAATVEQRITLDGPRTRVALVTAQSARMPAILARPEDGDAVASMQRAVSAAGAPALPPDRGLTLIFPGAPMPAVETVRAAWMIEALLRARADERLHAAASAHAPDVDPHLSAVWRPIVRTVSCHPHPALAAAPQYLSALQQASPATLVSAAALRSLLYAVAPLQPWSEREVESISASQLSAWTRQPGPRSGQWRGKAPGDARWIWGLALLMLAVETIVRRTHQEGREEGRRAA
jgi:hypothetical protein